MRLTLLAGVLLVSLGSAGCEPFPDSPIFFYGMALRADGSPFHSTALPLDGGRHSKIYRDPLDFSPYGMTTTRDNGAFVLEILSGDIGPFVTGGGSSPRPNARARFRVATPLEDGPAAFVSFTQVNGGGDSELPVLRVWDADLAWSDAPTGRWLTFAPPPSAPEAPRGVVVDIDDTTPQPGSPEGDLEDPSIPRPVFQLHTKEGLVWNEEAVTSPRLLSPWLLEDFATLEAQVRVVSAGAWRRDALTSDEAWLHFRLEWRSERLPLPAGALRPLSRGARCHPVTDVPCPFTDGLLAEQRISELWPRGEPSSSPRRVGVQLETPAQLSRVVIRGLRTYGQEVVIEGSEDGVQWSELARRPLAEAPTTGNSRLFRNVSDADSPWDPPIPGYEYAFLDISLPGGPPVRYVRLLSMWPSPQEIEVTSIAELSLFE
ncbi:hypothetical protein HUA78_15480 [Myxococcus sp. CA033]|uniref:hypothetical protein n=1 Tax=Myxococcus sp. CA033 TaxID=2741516 RepID=UPI00157AAC20|nr:hypothetical protein [Myxococcus sp. CA033]NTX35849.1 hypothetical protein [Myxococcus sp. CA033]